MKKNNIEKQYLMRLHYLVAEAMAMFVCLPLLAQKAYINKVYEYRPAPGQFINQMPQYSLGDTEETMRAKAEQILKTDEGVISLGGWGGYVVFGFDHTITNQHDYDFQILGNAFYANPDNPAEGGSAEPGVVYVSFDQNHNGKPDDTWYEIAGSEYSKSVHNYQLTYFRTPADHVRTPKPAEDLVDTTYIMWRDIDGKIGYIEQNRYNLQSYYPQWLSADKLVYSGTLLPSNAIGKIKDGKTQYVLYAFDYGYADNHPNLTEGSKFKIDWAVKSNGQAANLAGIDFIKVMTGVNQQCGWIGETSTEINTALDLHPSAVLTDLNTPSKPQKTTKILRNGQLIILHNGQEYDILGRTIK